MNTRLEIGDVVEVLTERLAYGGDAIARHNGLAIFIPFAVQGERLRIRITERKKNFARAVIEEILEASPSRRQPPCQYFGDCGGCQLQHMTYESQLQAKLGFVRDALQRIGRIDWPHEIEIRHASEFGYRARAQVRTNRDTGHVGFNRAGSPAVCDVDGCPILVPELDEALRLFRKTLAEPAAEHQDLDLSKVEMAAGESGVGFEPSLKGLPRVTLKRAVRDAAYTFSPSTFFQVNPALLGDLVDEALGADSGKLAIDLYAGVGLFTIQLARRFNQVIGVESDRATAKFAFENITANGSTNIEFHNANVESWLASFISQHGATPDLVLLDPPRTGAARALPKIVALMPSRITYVSCDPATLARDLRTLVDSGYGVSRITAIDLFPQTYHVETIAALVRR